MIQEALRLHQLGHLDEALALYNKVLIKDKNNGDALNLKGILLASVHRVEEAKITFEKVVKLYPENIDFKFSLQNLYRNSGQIDQTVLLLLEILKQDKNHLPSLKAIGSLYFNQEDYASAKVYYDRYFKLFSNDLDVVYSLAYCLYKAQDYIKSIDLFKICEAGSPTNVSFILMIGMSYFESKQYKVSIEFFDKVLKIDPENKDSLYFKSMALFVSGSFEEAYISIRILFGIAPAYKSVLSKYINYSKACLIDYSKDLDEKLNKAIFNSESIEHFIEEPVDTLRRIDSLSLNLKIAQQFVSLLKNQVTCTEFDYKHNGRMKVAYLSGDFNDHPVGVSIEGVLRSHSNAEIDYCLISLSPCSGSVISKRIRNINIPIYDCSNLSRNELVTKIRSLNVSILVDLVGHYKDVSIDLHLARVAPVQVWYLGYAGTSGCEAVDYLISDKNCIPPRYEQYYSEKVYHLDGIYHSYTPIEDSEEMFIGPVNTLATKRFTLGLVTNSTKISVKMLENICTLLLELPESQLVISNMSDFVLSNLFKKLESKGIDKSRWITLPYSKNRKDYLKKISTIDLLLDTEIHNAHSTLLDFLYMGVPSVALRGQQFAARVSSSFLETIGMTELIAENFEQHNKIIRSFYLDKGEFMNMKQKLSNNLKTTSMFSPLKKAKDLEITYKGMWETYLGQS